MLTSSDSTSFEAEDDQPRIERQDKDRGKDPGVLFDELDDGAEELESRTEEVLERCAVFEILESSEDFRRLLRNVCDEGVDKLLNLGCRDLLEGLLGELRNTRHVEAEMTGLQLLGVRGGCGG